MFSGRKRGDDQTGPMCIRLKKRLADAHGSGFLCPRVGAGRPSHRRQSIPRIVLKPWRPFAHPFVEVASGRLLAGEDRKSAFVAGY
jgi:hypothetical protein